MYDSTYCMDAAEFNENSMQVSQLTFRLLLNLRSLDNLNRWNHITRNNYINTTYAIFKQQKKNIVLPDKIKSLLLISIAFKSR